MDPSYPPEAEAYREKVQAFLAEHLPAGWKGIGALEREDASVFRARVAHARWPSTAARRRRGPRSTAAAGSPPLEQVVLAEEFYKAGVPTGGDNDVFGIQMVGNTILQWGTDEQKAHFLPAHPVAARTCGARATPSPTPAPTSATSAAGPSSTATSG